LIIALSNSWLFSVIFVRSETYTSDRRVNDSGFIYFKCNFSAFYFFTAADTSLVTVPVLGSASGFEVLIFYLISRSLAVQKVLQRSHLYQPTHLQFLDELIQSYKISTCSFCFGFFIRSAKHQYFFGFTSSMGQTYGPRTDWSAFFGSTPRRICKSTEASNFGGLISFTREEASFNEYAWLLSTLAAAIFFF